VVTRDNGSSSFADVRVEKNANAKQDRETLTG